MQHRLVFPRITAAGSRCDPIDQVVQIRRGKLRFLFVHRLLRWVPEAVALHRLLQLPSLGSNLLGALLFLPLLFGTFQLQLFPHGCPAFFGILLRLPQPLQLFLFFALGVKKAVGLQSILLLGALARA